MAIFDDTRADWNARPPLSARTRVPWSERIGVSWHWIGPGKGPSAAGSHQKCLDQVRDWQEQHQRKGWKDVGYNALVCQHALAIEGRGLDYSGSHSPGVNWSHVGIQFMVGEDTPGGATPAMFARAVRLRADIGALGKNIRRDWRHKDDPEAGTECCGPQIGGWVLSGGPTKTGIATPRTTLRPGDRGDDVTALQRLLIAAGATITADGSYGPATEAAVTTFQKSAGLTVDGIAGPLTRTALTSPEEDDGMKLTDKVPVRNPQTNVIEQIPYSWLLNRMDFTYHETLRQKATLDAIAAKLLSPDEIAAAAERGTQAALDARISGAEVTLEVQP